MPFDASAVAGLLFDLDGTLIDLQRRPGGQRQLAAPARGRPARNPALITSYVGDGVEALVRRLLQRPDGDVAATVDAFKAHYHDHCLDQDPLLTRGVLATLQARQAKGLKMAVVTNKPERISRRILDGLETDRIWGSVIGGNTCKNKKPHPEPLLRACGDLGVQPHQCAMVGDSRVDVEAGKNAACQTVGLLGGIAIRTRTKNNKKKKKNGSWEPHQQQVQEEEREQQGETQVDRGQNPAAEVDFERREQGAGRYQSEQHNPLARCADVLHTTLGFAHLEDPIGAQLGGKVECRAQSRDGEEGERQWNDQQAGGDEGNRAALRAAPRSARSLGSAMAHAMPAYVARNNR